MYFGKVHHPANAIAPDRIGKDGRLRFGKRTASLAIHDHGGDCWHVDVDGPSWEVRHNLNELTPAGDGPSTTRLEIDADGALRLRGADGEVWLETLPGRPLSVCGQGWIVEFVPQPGDRHYGLGEKNNGFEKSGKRTKFWNTDVWADFPMDPVKNGVTDPMYASLPVLITKRGGRFLAIVVDNPGAVFLCTSPDLTISQQRSAKWPPSFHLGAPSLRPSLWIIADGDPLRLIRRLQRLVGTTPLPPLWALGHHQCRFGYESFAQLDALDRRYRRLGIPTDGLWLDIGFMDGFRVFTWDKRHWPKLTAQLADLAARGRRIVPIIDPGVKVDAGYPVYDSGLAEQAFCQTAEGRPYIGFVWPGATHFPDFSRADARAWWGGWVQRFFALPIAGAWLDMNDPATGAAELDEMRFDRGRLPHEVHHNQYALGMAMATRAGVLAQRPDERPFLLTRSGSVGIGRFAAMWTGDNWSNRHHLAGTIALSINLALSGVPFNGPDVPGFGGDATPELMRDWYQAGFLFPFFRNHANNSSIDQEPWVFGKRTCDLVAHYIRLRYRLLPWLYNRFIDQEVSGEPILRPLWMHWPERTDYELIGDQFLVGADIMQAPILAEGPRRRKVALPPGWWFAGHTGRFERGGITRTVRVGPAATPLWVRAGALIPMLPTEPRDAAAARLDDITLHAIARPGGTAEGVYAWDDGATFAYRRGQRSRIAVAVTVRGREAVARITAADVAGGGLRLRFACYQRVERVRVILPDGGERVLAAKPGAWTFTGARCRVWTSAPLRLG
jgi:alpha-glucosidase